MQNYKLFKKGNRKGTIVFIHGNSASSESFKPVFDDDEICYDLLAFDLIGCGNSPHYDNMEEYSYSSFMNQSLNIINEVDGPILLVGHSLGGHIAIEIANSISNLVGVLIFGAPPIKIPLNFEEAFTPTEFMPAYYMEYPGEEMIHKLFISILFNKDPFPLLVKDFKRSDPKLRTGLATAIQVPKDLNDEVEILTNLTCKKYIIITNDVNINISYVLRENAKMNCKIYEIPLSGHFPTLEAPVEFNRILKEIAEEVF